MDDGYCIHFEGQTVLDAMISLKIMNFGTAAVALKLRDWPRRCSVFNHIKLKSGQAPLPVLEPDASLADDFCSSTYVHLLARILVYILVLILLV